jgi:hypothetical protein
MSLLYYSLISRLVNEEGPWIYIFLSIGKLRFEWIVLSLASLFYLEYTLDYAYNR